MFLADVVYEQYFLSLPEPTASFAYKTVIITGSNTGLGKEAARHIARLGCPRLILAVRNTTAGESAKQGIVSTTGVPASSISIWALDLSSFASVKAFTARATSELDRLDVVICNAGVSKRKFSVAEGYETILTTNVLSTFLLALDLLPLLEKTAALPRRESDDRPPHLTIVSSETYVLAAFPERDAPPAALLDRITQRASKDTLRAMMEQYPLSKLLEIMLVRDLVFRQQRYPEGSDAPGNKGVIINTVNPGLCHSSLTRELGFLPRVMKFVLHARATDVGARTLVHAAAAGWETHGRYLSSCRVWQVKGLAVDKELGQRVWEAVDGALKKA